MSVFDAIREVLPFGAKPATNGHVPDWRDSLLDRMIEAQSIQELELRDRAENWELIGTTGGRGLELTRQWLRDATTLARLFYLANPLINRAVELQKVYVW